MVLLWLLYLWQPYLQWPYLWGSGQVFQPTKPIKVLKQKHDQSATNGASKKATKNWAYLHSLINPANKNGCDIQGYSFCSADWAYAVTLPAVYIKLTKAVISLWVNIKPTRLLTPLWYMRSLFLQYALSLQDPLPLLQEHTKSTESSKAIKKQRLTWPLNSLQ